MKVLFPIVSVVLALVPLGAGAQYKEKEMVDPGGSNKVVDRTDRTAVLAGIALLVYAAVAKRPARAVHPEETPKKQAPTHYAKSLRG